MSSTAKNLAEQHQLLANRVMEEVNASPSLEAYRVAAYLLERSAWMHIAADVSTSLDKFIMAWATHHNVAVRAGLNVDSDDS